jgi:hypothetical protein
MILYLAIQLKGMVIGSSPIVNTLTDLDVHTTEEGAFNLTDRGFMVAFGVRNYLDNEFKDSTKYVEWSALLFEGDGST